MKPRLGNPPDLQRRETIRAAIASVAAADLRRWELIVVDDGSTDDTAALVEGSDRVSS